MSERKQEQKSVGLPLNNSQKQSNMYSIFGKQYQHLAPQFKNIKKSIQILKEFIPEFFTQELVQKIYNKAIISSFIQVTTQVPQTNQASNHLLKHCPPPTLASKAQNRQQKKANDKLSKIIKQQRYELHGKWCIEYQKLLLQLYSKSAHICKIRDKFQQVYPQNSHLFTIEALKSKLNKTIRAGIKKMQFLIEQHRSSQLAPLIKLNQKKIGKIIASQYFRKVRLSILKVYIEEYNMNVLNQSINLINQYFTYYFPDSQSSTDETKRNSKQDEANQQPILNFNQYKSFQFESI